MEPRPEAAPPGDDAPVEPPYVPEPRPRSRVLPMVGGLAVLAAGGGLWAALRPATPTPDPTGFRVAYKAAYDHCMQDPSGRMHLLNTPKVLSPDKACHLTVERQMEAEGRKRPTGFRPDGG